MATMYQGSERMRPTATICCLYKSPADVIRTLLQFDSYRPELHYMRGPGPKWHAKHELAFASLDGATPATTNADTVPGANNEAKRDASPSVLESSKNWPNATFAAVWLAAVLSVLFLLFIATSLISFSSSPVNADPPRNGCVAVSKGEYRGAYKKNLLRTRFGTYVRMGRLGRYSYWYCH